MPREPRVPETPFDVVAPGEVMLRLASRPPTRLEQARELLRAGGALR